MNVIMISPGFPDDMPLFTHGLAEVGARVFGVGDQPRGALPEKAASAVSQYLQVRDLWDEDAVAQEVAKWVGGTTIDRVECLWEPGMVLAARIREKIGVPGLPVAATIPFRDKVSMKEVLDRAGLRTPKHSRAKTKAECRAAAEEIGYPLIIKPIAGAGSADTYRLQEAGDLENALQVMDHVDEVSVEEFIQGEEYTFDTVLGDGDVLFHNVAWYRPNPLVSRQNPWISPQAICLRDTETPEIAIGCELGLSVLKALGYGSGFAHMEWFRTEAGEAVFGEIGARAPGGHLTHVMNYAADVDLFRGWAEGVCYGRMSQDTSKPYNAAVVFKRAKGNGIVRKYDGLQSVLGRYGEHVAHIDLTPIGQPRRDYRKVVSGDGWVVVRHPDLGFTLEMADAVSNEFVIQAS